MRLNLCNYLLPLAAMLAVAAILPAQAEPAKDRVYADSFGNLIIHSPSGSKRIVVGAGDLAAELTRYTGGGKAEAAEAAPAFDQHIRVSRFYCRSNGAFVKGRSYMYGLEDGAIPVLGCSGQ